jgi:hypothetical protein
VFLQKYLHNCRETFKRKSVKTILMGTNKFSCIRKSAPDTLHLSLILLLIRIKFPSLSFITLVNIII